MQLQYTWLTSTPRSGHGVQRSAASQSDVKRREATDQAPLYMLANSAEGTRVHAALAIAEGMHSVGKISFYTAYNPSVCVCVCVCVYLDVFVWCLCLCLCVCLSVFA